MGDITAVSATGHYFASHLVSDLYSDPIVDEFLNLMKHYLKTQRDSPTYIDMPSSLHGVTHRKRLYSPVINAPDEVTHPIFEYLGIIKDGKVKGPMNHILARFITIPMMLKDFVDNYPTEEERVQYADPPLFQLPRDHLKRVFDDIFAQVYEKLQDEKELKHRFDVLGDLGEGVATQIETAYPANGSTEAYETFGIFHLFPSNKRVDITSTSPGIILPTEANPLKYKDSVPELKKNLLRPTYFEMLRLAALLEDGRIRKYFASREGTKDNLLKYPQFVENAKEILQRYIGLGSDKFRIRIGNVLPDMRLATLVGDRGVVYSIRDKEQKSKIAHNVTVIDPKEAKRWREIFDDQYDAGEDVTSEIVDQLVKE